MTASTLWNRLARGIWRVHERADWAGFVGKDWAATVMDVPVTDSFHAKQGRSTGRWVLQRDGRRLAVFLKRHYRLPRWRGLMAALWPEKNWSPAVQEWNHLEWARSQGMPVPATVAVGEFIGPWCRLQSFLAVEELGGMVPLHKAIPLAAEAMRPATFRHWKRTLIAEVARLTRALHGRRWFHKDLYLCHFFIPREDTGGVPCWSGRVHVIDLHRMAHHAHSWRVWQIKDLAELLYSSAVPGMTARDRAWFWRCYLGPDRRTRSGRWLRSAVLWKWRRYVRHNEKQRARLAA